MESNNTEQSARKREFSKDDTENAYYSLAIDIVFGFKFIKKEELLVSIKERNKHIVH